MGHMGSVSERNQRTNGPISAAPASQPGRPRRFRGEEIWRPAPGVAPPETALTFAEEDDVGDADESVVLTDREREALAGLAESIGDPWLAGQLAGRDHAPAGPKPSHRPPAWLRLAATGWFGLVLVVAGALLTLTTFTDSTPAATAGLAVMGVGLWRFLAVHGERISRRMGARKTPEA